VARDRHPSSPTGPGTPLNSSASEGSDRSWAVAALKEGCRFARHSCR
jgi:hypothetical protein